MSIASTHYDDHEKLAMARAAPQRGCRSLFSKAIVDPPASLTGPGDQQVQASAVGELVGLVARNCLSDCQIGKHEATFLPVSIPSKMPSDTVNRNDFSRMPVDARSVKTFDFMDFSGRLRMRPKRKMVPEEDSKFNAMILISFFIIR